MKTITLRFKKHFCLTLTRACMMLVVLATISTSEVKAASAKSLFFLETNRVWINVTSPQGGFSQTLMGYRTGATDGVDQGLDGAYWNDGALALASLIGDVRYAIQFKGLPFSVTDAVPLSFKTVSSGTFTFAIDHMDGFFTNATMAVYLHDTQTNTYTNLKTGNYTFTSQAGMFNNRFKLTYSNVSTALNTADHELTAGNLEIYKANQDIVVKSGNTVLNQIQLYTINGQVIYDNRKLHATETSIPNLNITPQAVVVKVTTVDGKTITKKWLYL